MKISFMPGDDLSLLVQLGQRIAYLRSEKGVSQLQFSLIAGVSKNYLNDLEHGRRNPSVLVLERIAKGLNVTLEELFRGVVALEDILG